MTTDLAQWALALPLRVRQELAKIPGPHWHVCRMSGAYDWSICDRCGREFLILEGEVDVPCDPTAILAHAAGLFAQGAAGRWGMTTERGATRATVARLGSAHRGYGEVWAAEVDPHRAAVAVLAKVLAVVARAWLATAQEPVDNDTNHARVLTK